MSLVTKHEYLAGRPCYAVPVVDHGDKGFSPRIPQTQNFNCHAFYSPDNTVAYVAATLGLANYLAKRSYATYLGVIGYDPAGVSAGSPIVLEGVDSNDSA